MSYDPWSNPQVLPEEEGISLNETVKEREVERAKTRSSYRHTLGIVRLFAEEGESKKSIEAKARKEWRRNCRMTQRGRVSYENERGISTLAIIPTTRTTKIFSFLRATPRRIRSSASAASRHRQEDDAGGGDPDDSDLPPRQRSEIEYLRSLTGRKGGILERTYRLSLLAGGVAR